MKNRFISILLTITLLISLFSHIDVFASDTAKSYNYRVGSGAVPPHGGSESQGAIYGYYVVPLNSTKDDLGNLELSKSKDSEIMGFIGDENFKGFGKSKSLAVSESIAKRIINQVSNLYINKDKFNSIVWFTGPTTYYGSSGIRTKDYKGLFSNGNIPIRTGSSDYGYLIKNKIDCDLTLSMMWYRDTINNYDLKKSINSKLLDSIDSFESWISSNYNNESGSNVELLRYGAFMAMVYNNISLDAINDKFKKSGYIQMRKLLKELSGKYIVGSKLNQEQKDLIISGSYVKFAKNRFSGNEVNALKSGTFKFLFNYLLITKYNTVNDNNTSDNVTIGKNTEINNNIKLDTGGLDYIILWVPLDLRYDYKPSAISVNVIHPMAYVYAAPFIEQKAPASKTVNGTVNTYWGTKCIEKLKTAYDIPTEYGEYTKINGEKVSASDNNAWKVMGITNTQHSGKVQAILGNDHLKWKANPFTSGWKWSDGKYDFSNTPNPQQYGTWKYDCSNSNGEGIDLFKGFTKNKVTSQNGKHIKSLPFLIWDTFSFKVNGSEPKEPKLMSQVRVVYNDAKGNGIKDLSGYTAKNDFSKNVNKLKSHSVIGKDNRKTKKPYVLYESRLDVSTLPKTKDGFKITIQGTCFIDKTPNNPTVANNIKSGIKVSYDQKIEPVKATSDGYNDKSKVDDRFTVEDKIPTGKIEIKPAGVASPSSISFVREFNFSKTNKDNELKYGKKTVDISDGGKKYIWIKVPLDTSNIALNGTDVYSIIGATVKSKIEFKDDKNNGHILWANKISDKNLSQTEFSNDRWRWDEGLFKDSIFFEKNGSANLNDYFKVTDKDSFKKNGKVYNFALFTHNDPPNIPNDKEEPFEYHSTLDNKVFAELKANEPFNEDWNAMEGVPSDERLFVAAGADKFQVDVSGVSTFQKNITRNIKFNVTLAESWGDNVPDSLSNKRHKIHTFTVKGPDIEVPSSGWSTSHPFLGPVTGTSPDGATYTVSATEESKHVVDSTDKKGNETRGHEEYMTSGARGGYSATANFYFNDGTGTFEHDNSGGTTGSAQGSLAPSNIVGTAKLNKWKQVYEMNGPAKCYQGKVMQPSTVIKHPEQISDGYTNGKGSVLSKNWNALHRQSEEGSVTIQEKIDKIHYLNIRDYAINGLYKVDTSDADQKLFEDTANGKSVGNPLQASVYNIKGHGDYKSGNGRIWFTKPIDVLWSSGGPGWKSTSVSEHYWLGDMAVNITVYPDNKYSNNAGKLHTASIRANAGALDDNNWKSEDAGEDSYKTKDYVGDYTGGGIRSKMVAATVNRWMKANDNNKYTAHIVSDALGIGTQVGNKWQDVVAAIYHIDDGISLFSKPFSNEGQTISISHKGKSKKLEDLWDKGGADTKRTVYRDDEISFDGYNGKITPFSKDKYITGSDFDKSETLKPFLQSLNNEDDLTERFKDGMDYNQGSPKYTNTGQVYAYNNPEFVAKSTITETPSGANTTYNGYYEDYNLSGAMPVISTNVQFGNFVDTPELAANAFTNSAYANVQKYRIAMVVSDLDLKDRDARNGAYYSPITARAYWATMLKKFETGEPSGWPTREKQKVAMYTDEYVNELGERDKINSIVVHTPIATQYSRLVPYDQQILTDDHEDMYDLRVNKTGNKYVLIGDHTEIFYSPLGDFYDSSGKSYDYHISNSRGMGANSLHISVDKPDKFIELGWDGYRKNHSSVGFTNSMDTSRWMKSSKIKLPYAYYYFDTNGNKVTVDREELVDLSTFGPKSKVKARCISKDGTYGVPGYVLSVFVLTSSNEFNSIETKTEAEAINKDTSIDSISNHNETNGIRLSYYSEHDCEWFERTDVVGRLGNLTMTDTEDWRFSNAFRKPKDTWRIPNIIRDVHLDIPNQVAADSKNILCKPVPFDGMGHSTLGQTYFREEEKKSDSLPWTDGIAKANNNYMDLPLTPAKNPIPELRNEPLRMGYSMFMDVETIGEYYGNGRISPPSPTDRFHGIEIKPNYMLYDLDKKEYIPIDIYYGDRKKEKIYEYGKEVGKTSYEYTIDTLKEIERRNISEVEKRTTNKIVGDGVKFGTLKNVPIGNVSNIFLNAFVRDYIGSSVIESGIDIYEGVPKVVAETPMTNWQNTYNSGYSWDYDFHKDNSTNLSESDFQERNQRWYWKIGLPSSSLIVPHGNIPPGTSIESLNAAFKRKHRNSIILCTAKIVAKGEVWELEYNSNFMNNGEITVFETPKKKIKIPKPGMVNGIDHSKYALINVYNAWETSVSDKDVRGTH